MTYTVVGCNDEQTVCDCCGKAGLKKTVILRDEDGEFVRYGTTCAVKATAVRGARTKADLDRTITAANAEVAKQQFRLAQAAGNLTDSARLIGNLRYNECYGDGYSFWTRNYDSAAAALHSLGVAC